MKTSWLYKKSFRQHKYCPAPVIPCLLFLLLNICSLQSLAQEDAAIQDTIVVNKLHSGTKHKIRIYPNATHEVLFFTANGEEGKVYQLFLFDVDGKLVKQTTVNNRQTGFLSRFTKGSYGYEVFSNDERIEDGNIIIK
ncbi:MAG TPA: T9SS type A sorting domain-containing protein [Chitinophagaceae bacterium]|nr:T9SS type A sorting domain-containing protein [Chitinophagaceae bacterium]